MPEGHHDARSLTAGAVSYELVCRVPDYKGRIWVRRSAGVARLRAASRRAQSLMAQARHQQKYEHSSRRAEHGQTERCRVAARNLVQQA